MIFQESLEEKKEIYTLKLSNTPTFSNVHNLEIEF